MGRAEKHFSAIALASALWLGGSLPACQDGGAKLCREHADLCVGVDTAKLTSNPYFTDGVQCAQIVHVKAGAVGGTGSEAAPLGDLPPAATVAGPGDCIALAAGRYVAAALPAGVSLLGPGAKVTTIFTSSGAPLRLETRAGMQISARGFSVTSGTSGLGIAILGDGDARVEQVNVEATWSYGVLHAGSGSVNLRHVRVADVGSLSASEGAAGIFARSAGLLLVEAAVVENVAGVGVAASDSSLTLRDSVVIGSAGYGVAGLCVTCTTPPQVDVSGTLIADNGDVGLWLSGVSATIGTTQILETQAVGEWSTLGRGLEAIDVPDLQLAQVTISGCNGVGALLTDSSGTLENLTTDRNARGLWIQATGSATGIAVSVLDVAMAENDLIGLGVLGPASVLVSGGAIQSTRLVSTITPQFTSITMGDGVQILEDADVAISDVDLTDNPRLAILIDAALNVQISGNRISHAPNAEAIVVQNRGGVGWDPIEAISGNTDAVGAPVAHIEPQTPFDFDPIQLPVGFDPIQ